MDHENTITNKLTKTICHYDKRYPNKYMKNKRKKVSILAYAAKTEQELTT